MYKILSYTYMKLRDKKIANLYSVSITAVRLPIINEFTGELGESRRPKATNM